MKNCEHCEKEVEEVSEHELCNDCEDFLYCECGVRLEDAAGTPGDGFCQKCD
jgi:hypothetical protein